MAALKRWLIIAVGLFSVTAGLIYINGELFGFRFLGPEIGSERSTVLFWSRNSIGLGFILLVTLLIRPKMREQINDGLLILMLGLLFIIQLPPFSLWLLFAFFGNVEVAAGIMLHALPLAGIIRIVTLGRREKAQL
ncbi:hypothetical protein [Paenibacillus harenae]|uniref:hypothetical protein n=1 Tax=Paenibacillus harenae TaxID=306543 RepID=UPI0004107FC7|nr:hypothetical protein [Paenibacillus harenae]